MPIIPEKLGPWTAIASLYFLVDGLLKLGHAFFGQEGSAAEAILGGVMIFLSAELINEARKK